MPTLTIHDETASGQKTHSFTMDCLTERLTVGDLIKARIYQEVQDYNLREPEYFRGLVEPSQAERVLNGYKLKARRKIDWEEQYERALEAFKRNGFFVLVGDKQAESLEQEFEVKVETMIRLGQMAGKGVPPSTGRPGRSGSWAPPPPPGARFWSGWCPG